MFDRMKKTALQWLEKQDLVQIASNAGVIFDGTAFYFASLGQQIRLAYPN